MNHSEYIKRLEAALQYAVDTHLKEIAPRKPSQTGILFEANVTGILKGDKPKPLYLGEEDE